MLILKDDEGRKWQWWREGSHDGQKSVHIIVSDEWKTKKVGVLAKVKFSI